MQCIQNFPSRLRFFASKIHYQPNINVAFLCHRGDNLSLFIAAYEYFVPPPQYSLWITNRNSQETDRSVSVRMTLSSADVLDTVPLDIRTTKFGMVTCVRKAVFLGVKHGSHPKGPSVPKFWGPPTYAHTV